jgi:predicted RND superfamily exporter protein
MIIGQGVLMGFGILIGIVLIYLIVIIFFPVLSVPKQPIANQTGDHNERKRPPKYRYDVQFSVGDMNSKFRSSADDNK